MEIRDVNEISKGNHGNKRSYQKNRAFKFLEKSKNMNVMLRATIKSNPKRIIIGEFRDKEAMEEAYNSVMK